MTYVPHCFPSSEDDGVVQTHRVEDTEHVIDVSELSPGDYRVSVAVLLGDQTNSGAGDTMDATSLISVSGEMKPLHAVSL